MDFKLQNYETEILPVIEGLKDVSQQEIDLKIFKEYKKKLESLGLFVASISWTKFLTERKKNHSNPDKINDNRKAGMLIYFSKDKKKAEMAKKYDCNSDQNNFAKMLGYPICCISAFDYYSKRKIVNPLLSYFPCSNECKKTNEYLTKLKELIKKFSLEKNTAIFEKRKWVWITEACNNRCIFCLDGNKKRIFRTKEDVLKELRDGVKNGCTRLVLSGGEATIHPLFIYFIKKGKELGYKKIQVITNGRMFSYPKFLKRAIAAGLNEITFSVHGHTPELHDSLTSVKGSFEQTKNAIKNVLQKKIILSCDIVVNKRNIRHFPEIMKFLLDLGVREFDILHIMPFGNAWKNKEDLLYEIEENILYLKKGIDIGNSAGAVMWTNRLPPEFLEGYEEYIQDPYKLLDEVMGRKSLFEEALRKNNKLECYGERCRFCCLNELCKFIYKCNEAIKEKKLFREKEIDNEIIIITKHNYKELGKEISKLRKNKEIVLSLVSPDYDYENYSAIVPNIKNVLSQVYLLFYSGRFKIKNIPPCFIKPEYRNLILRDSFKIDKSFIKKDGIDIGKCCLQFINNKKIKGIRCKKCKFYGNCDGVFQKYVMLYGFKELNPIR